MATRKTPGTIKSPIKDNKDRNRKKKKGAYASVRHDLKSYDIGAKRRNKIIKRARTGDKTPLPPRKTIDLGKKERKSINTDVRKIQTKLAAQKNKGDGKGKGKGDGKGGKKKHKSPFYKPAKRMVRQEMRPQLQEIQRFIKQLRNQGKRDVNSEIRMGDRTQDDLEAIFGRANEFNTSQQAKIAEVLGQAQSGLSANYDAGAGNINSAYDKANEDANATLSRLGIQPVSARLQEDQAWMQGLNEQNRGLASQALATQQGIFAQAGGMLGQSIAGEGAAQMGTAATATAEAIRNRKFETRQTVNDLLSQKSDIKQNKGMMINQAQQLLKQQAFEQMMEQAQLQALNKQRASEMKLDWAELNSLNQYRQGQLQNQSNRLALDKWKAQNDVWLKKLGLKKDAMGDTPAAARQKFMDSNISGWKDAHSYASYMLSKKEGGAVVNDIIYDMQTGWNRGWEASNRNHRKQMYAAAKARLEKEGYWNGQTDGIIRDILNIGAGQF